MNLNHLFFNTDNGSFLKKITSNMKILLKFGDFVRYKLIFLALKTFLCFQDRVNQLKMLISDPKRVIKRMKKQYNYFTYK